MHPECGISLQDSQSREKYNCKVCLIEFSSLHYLNKHKKTVHQKVPCAECGKSFRSGSSMNNHIQAAHTPDNQNNFRCDTCGKSFTDNQLLSEHKNVHTGENLPVGRQKRYKCDICGKGFLNNRLLSDHTNVHTGGKPYECKFCSSCFASLETHRRHERGHIGDDKKYKCDICGKGFNANRLLSDHINIHTGEKPYKCKFCSSCFASQKTHRMHERGHTDDQKKFRCDVCGKGFLRNSFLSDHTNVHTGEKPYKCKFCSKCFASLGTHATHERGHTEKKYICDICDKGFLSNSLLSDHINIHTGEKPYKCKFCSSCFASLEQHAKHERRHIKSGVK